MPLFYFYLNGSSVLQDKGCELAGVEEAIMHAHVIALELSKNKHPGEIAGHELVVFDDAGNEVRRIPLYGPAIVRH